MSKGISEDAQIHISIAFLIKAMVGVAIVVGSWYQAQMKFAEQGRRIQDLEDKVVDVDGWLSKPQTKKIITQAHKRYNDKTN